MSAPASRATDPRSFRDVLSHFCSGVTVIAATADGRPVGLTCQSFFSVSLDPPLVAFAVSTGSTTYPGIRAAGRCAINVLASDQGALSDAFARHGSDRWAGVDWRPGELTGSPIIAGTLAWLECEIRSETDAGDHILVVAHVLDLASRLDAQPLLFFRGSYGFLRGDDLT